MVVVVREMVTLARQGMSHHIIAQFYVLDAKIISNIFLGLGRN